MLAVIELYAQFLFSQIPTNPKPFQNPNFYSQNPNFNPQNPNFNAKNHSCRQNVKSIAQFSLQLTTTTTSDRGLIFREEVLYLKKLNVNPGKAFRENPNLRNCPLRTLKTVQQCLSSIGIHKSDMGRILDMLPELLTCDPHDDIYPVLNFLLNEVRIPYHDVQKSILRCPRLLVSSVENRLRPALYFLKELGFVGPHSITCQTTLLLVSSVEDTLLPKVEFLMGLGFTHVEVCNMVVRSPGLLTLSVDKNLKPKVEFFWKEMNGDIAELKRFPQYFSFSLERRIKPRYAMLVELGLELNLEDMLTVSDGGFESRLFKMRLRAIEGRQL